MANFKKDDYQFLGEIAYTGYKNYKYTKDMSKSVCLLVESRLTDKIM